MKRLIRRTLRIAPQGIENYSRSPMTLWEFYDELIDLEALLNGTEDAEALRTARLGGATSGEILERVWFALRKLRDIRPDLSVRIDTLLAYIDATLPGPTP